MTDADRLSSTLQQLHAAAAAGALVDLSGLMPEIERLCADARADTDTRKAADALHGLARALDALHGELARAEEATRRSAMEAYSG
jgi:hypothetical protein